MSETSNFAINEAMKEITAGAKSVIPGIPEAVFVKDYLPLFTSKEPVNISKWLEVAGTATTPVMVMGSDGTALFEVPALMRDVKFRPARSAKDSVTEIVADAANKARVNPSYAMNYLNHALQDRIADNTLDVGDMVAWNRIFARYGYPPVKLPGELMPKDATEGHQSSDDKPVKFDDFEEL